MCMYTDMYTHIKVCCWWKCYLFPGNIYRNKCKLHYYSNFYVKKPIIYRYIYIICLLIYSSSIMKREKTKIKKGENQGINYRHNKQVRYKKPNRKKYNQKEKERTQKNINVHRNRQTHRNSNSHKLKLHYEILYRIESTKTDANRNISSLHLDKDFLNLICTGKW